MKTWQFLVQLPSCAFQKWKSKNTKGCQEEKRILDKWLLKLGSSFNKGNKNEDFTKGIIRSSLHFIRLCYRPNLFYCLIYLTDGVTTYWIDKLFQLFNHGAIVLLYFHSPNLKQIQPCVQMVSWTCNASQQAGLYPSDYLSIPES